VRAVVGVKKNHLQQLLIGWSAGLYCQYGWGGGSNNYRVHREKKERVLIAENSDTKLRIIRRLNLLVSQYFQ